MWRAPRACPAAPAAAARDGRAQRPRLLPACPCLTAHAGRTSGAYREQNVGADKPVGACYLGSEFVISRILDGFDRAESGVGDAVEVISQDRKSTRLNSSHVSISYAVF